MRNEDEIDKSHKSQLKFKKNLNWAFEGFPIFFFPFPFPFFSLPSPCPFFFRPLHFTFHLLRLFPSSPHRPFLSSFPTAFPLPEIQPGVPGNAVSSLSGVWA